MKTHTHYTDAHGQHELPPMLRNIEIEVGAVIATSDELDDMPDEEVDETLRVLRGLGWAADNVDGDLTVTGRIE